MGFFEKLWNSIVNFFKGILDSAGDILMVILEILLICLAAKILIAIGTAIVKRSLKKKIEKNPTSLSAKKSETIITMMSSVIRYTVYFLAIASILGVIGLGATVGSLIATAGIGGIALGLGAQAFIKDVVGGFLLLFEDEYAVSDYIKIAGLSGTVESISLRTTRLRLANNEIATVPNGQIDTVINYTRDNYLLYFDVEISYAEDATRAFELMQQVGVQYAEGNANVISGPIPMGITKLSPGKVRLRINFYVKPLSQWAVSRELNAKIIEAFKTNQIEVPDYQNCVVIGVSE